MTQQLISPYGGELKWLYLDSETEINAWQKRAARDKFPKLKLSSREAGDLEMLGNGGFSPLEGFMGHDDWLGVCRDMRTAAGVFWPIPITFAVSKEDAEPLQEGDYCQLIDPNDQLVAILQLQDKYQADKKLEAESVFATTDEAHPGVANLYAHQDVYLGGKVILLKQNLLRQEFPGIYLTPAETRSKFTELGWSKVTAFQTRNPMHRAHEHLVKTALEVSDGVLIHSLLGKLKQGDIPAAVRIQAIDALIKSHFVPGSVINAGYPLDMRYAGPREALLHAVFRQNYGCSQIIIGRDHAGVGSYYDEFAAQRIFDEPAVAALQIKPLKLPATFWCDACRDMVSTDNCPHSDKERLHLSGTELRRLLSTGEEVPANFSRPEVLQVLRQYYEGL